MEPQKPFACPMPDCGLFFTNEDHLNVHIKKHDMVLQLGAEQKTTFVADQTPTPTRFIRNCEEVGLFQDLQNVNPFDEGFKRAMETKAGALSLEGHLSGSATDDALHTPQMVYPQLGDGGDFGRRSVPVSRSSSDESGTIKGYETTTISKMTNEVTTISRVVGKDLASTDDHNVGKETVSFTNNVIQIHSNVEIRKDQDSVKPVALVEVFTDSVIKDTNVVTKDVMLADSNKLQLPDKLPVMSQRSIDFVVDSLTNEACGDTIDLDAEKESLRLLKKNLAKKRGDKERPNRSVIMINEVLKASDELKKQKAAATAPNEDYEVIIKLPNKRTIRMKAVDEINELGDHRQVKQETKQKLKQALVDKAEKTQIKAENHIPVIKRINSENDKVLPNIVALYPVALVNSVQTPFLITNTLQKIPIPLEHPATNAGRANTFAKRTAIKRVLNKNQAKHSKVTKTNATNTQVRAETDLGDWSIANAHTAVVPNGEEVGPVKSTEPQTQRKADCSNTFEDKSTFAKQYLERRSAASRRYRERLKCSMQSLKNENQHLKEQNQRLRAANAALKGLMNKHRQRCPCAGDLQNMGDESESELPCTMKQAA